ncbi:MAG: EcsC family protein [Eubacteriales bacterium]|nr:EcsC family protein [Eubacteriales bacterium]
MKRFFEKKTPFQKEWARLNVQEERFLRKHLERKESFLNQKLEEKVPPKLQQTLDAAFAKAFGLIFEKGTGVIEKTYPREKLEQDYKIRQYTAKIKQDSKSLRAFTRKARDTSAKNLLISGASGVGMGVLGIGIPDIPVFTGMLLKTIYELALHYGYTYDTEQERYFILLMIQGAVSCGENYCSLNHAVDRFIETETLPEDYDERKQIAETASVLSKELLYMKFLQGIPVVGAVGGAYDAIYMKQISEYAALKYRRRYLRKQERNWEFEGN